MAEPLSNTMSQASQNHQLLTPASAITISPDGFALTAASHLLDTPDLRVPSVRRPAGHAKVVVIEPELDLALIKIDKVDDLPYFDLPAAAKAPPAQPGDWVLAFSNQFEIADPRRAGQRAARRDRRAHQAAPAARHLRRPVPGRRLRPRRHHQ